MNRTVQLAKDYCRHFHRHQYRKNGHQPYYVHPFAVASLLSSYGYTDTVTQCIAYLHDVVEDSGVTVSELREVFGYEIANGVFILSKNRGDSLSGGPISASEYVQRLAWARRKIKRVKIADMIDNTRDIEVLNPSGIRKKLQQAREVYIPWGNEIAPLMVRELSRNIQKYVQN